MPDSDSDKVLDQYISGLRGSAREAFKKLHEEEQQTLVVDAFRERSKDRSIACLVAPQGRNSAACTGRITAEPTAVYTTAIDTKWRGKSSKKALIGVSSSHAGTPDYSFEGSESAYK